jgi:hypothetical protein
MESSNRRFEIDGFRATDTSVYASVGFNGALFKFVLGGHFPTIPLVTPGAIIAQARPISSPAPGPE